MNNHISLTGHYNVKLIDKDSGVVKNTWNFENLITNAGLDAIGDGTYVNGLLTTGLFTLAVGAGSTTPSVTDVALASEVATSTNNGGFATTYGFNVSPEYGYMRVTRIFTTAQANTTLSELGFKSAGGVLFNRALILDSLGNPTTIVKTNQDILQIIYELRMLGPQSDITGTLDYGVYGSSTYILRPQGITSDQRWLDAIGSIGRWTFSNNGNVCLAAQSTFLNIRTGVNSPSLISGESIAPTSITVSSYVNGTYYRDVTYYWNTQTANFVSGVGSLVLTPWELTGGAARDRFLYQMQFTPALPKTDDFMIRFTMRYSWSR